MSLFSRKSQPSPEQLSDTDSVLQSYGPDGVFFASALKRGDWLGTSLEMGHDSELASLLSQLEGEGLAKYENEIVSLSWDQVFQLQMSPDYGSSYPLLGLPPTSDIKPALASHGTFSDPDFAVYISGWFESDGATPKSEVRLSGALASYDGQSFLLRNDRWRVVSAVRAFHAGAETNRTSESNRMAWGEIRRRAKQANAELSHFLESTIVVTADKLAIGLRKSPLEGDKVIEVVPSFDGQPARWIEVFDRSPQVRERYEIADGEGLVHVVTTPEVRTVLSEIKRMPARRVVGERAETFLRNPFAMLGPDAQSVIDPRQFETARENAGIVFSTFTARVERGPAGAVQSVHLLVEDNSGPSMNAEVVPFENQAELGQFIKKMEGRIRQEAQCCSWKGNDLEILGDTPNQLAVLKGAFDDWILANSPTASEIFDLSNYSERIEGFGIEKPYFSPFIARKSDGTGWFPDNVAFGVQYTPVGSENPVAVELSDSQLDALAKELQRAKDEGRSHVSFGELPEPVEIKQAEVMLNILQEAKREVADDSFRPEPTSGKALLKRSGLVVKANVDKIDYQELRGTLSLPERSKPALPNSLRSDVKLKDHQLYGVAWLQHLWSLSPSSCRGALLADDMGLGKTIQLLVFIAKCLEQDRSIDPFLIVAPVSLLENWKEEIDKFFSPGSLPILTLYGSALREKRAPQSTLNEELARSGITRLLVRDWLGDAKVVLTTYETLRDLEFSLARQRWSVMICDEAQKIKTPNAMVSRSAKKQNARFKIACTGTPVENTLTDLWCLFDFIQPGLLGALTDFGKTYRRPIEAETQEEKRRVEELRCLIEPQKLRRTKAEVAKDLPAKIVDSSCRSLQISDMQRELYGAAIARYRNGTNQAGANDQGSHLGLLAYLRTVCSDPRPPGPISPNLQSPPDLLRNSPKMAWTISRLAAIQEKREKVIIFCEFKELQRTIQRAIAERFGVMADIINGDTSAAADRSDNRQKRIKAFQTAEGFGVIILSPLAVGFGVNIQAANHVIHFTRTWNPAREDQATDRAYRIGQIKDVYVYYPVIVANDFLTFDGKLDQLLDFKRKLSEDMLNGSGDVGKADFADLQDPGGQVLFDDVNASSGSLLTGSATVQ
jgi:hypothetical protein